MRAILAGLFCVSFVFFLQAEKVSAAHIFLDTGGSVFPEGDVLYVPIRIDTMGECINAVSVAVSYNPEELSVQDVAIGDSIITLWTKSPIVERTEVGEVGHVVFEGGIPGGYCGRVIGDPGQTNILAKLVLSGTKKIIADDELQKTQLVIDPSTQAYLHDGSGNIASTTVLGSEIVFVRSTSTIENNWLDDIKSDTQAPELFEIIFVEGPSVGNDRHYIVFNTTDKQSGVDHYEVLETDPDRFGFLTWVSRESYWITATSPYVLRDQDLHSKIMVKAIDKNGNERIVTYIPEMSPLKELSQPHIIMSLLIVVCIVAVMIMSVVRFLNRKKMLKRDSEMQMHEDETL